METEENLPIIRADTFIVLTLMIGKIFQQLRRFDITSPVIYPNIVFLNQSLKLTENILRPVAQTLGILSSTVANDEILKADADSHLRVTADTSGSLKITACALSSFEEDFIPENPVSDIDIPLQLSQNYHEFLEDVKRLNPGFLDKADETNDVEIKHVLLNREQFDSFKNGIYKAMSILNIAKETMPYFSGTSKYANYQIKAKDFSRIIRGLMRVYTSVLHFLALGDRYDGLNDVLKHIDAAFEILDDIEKPGRRKILRPNNSFPLAYACYNHLFAMYIFISAEFAPVPEAVMDVPFPSTQA